MATLNLQEISSGTSLDDTTLNNNINLLNTVPLTGTTLNNIPTFSPNTYISAESINNVFTKIKENWIDTSNGTADAGDILDGEIAYVNGVEITGTIATQEATTITPGPNDQIAVEKGKYTAGDVIVKAISKPTISISDTGVITASTGGVSNSQQLATITAKTITPSTTRQPVVPARAYTLGAIVVNAVPTQEKTVTPTKSTQTVHPDSGKFLSRVVVSAISKPTISVSSDGLITASTGGAENSSQLETQVAKTITPSSSQQTAVAKNVYTTGDVTVAAVPTQTKTAKLSTLEQTITPDSGKFLSSVTIVPMPTVEQATPSIYVNSSGLITARSAQPSGYVSDGITSSTKQLKTQAAKTITPSSSQQTAVVRNVYTTGDVTVAAVPTQTKSVTPTTSAQTVTPDSGKYLTSVSVGAIPSMYITTSDATAVESDIALGKTAYVNGKKIPGNVPEITSNDVASYEYWACAASGDDIGVNCVVDKDSLIRKDAMIVLTVPKIEFGDATAADVAVGKTFTSAAGLKVPGTGGSSGGWTYVFFSTISDQPSDDVVSSVSNNLNLNSRVRELDVTLTKEFSEAKLIYATGFSEDISSQTFVISPSIESITGRDYEGMYYDDMDGALSSMVSPGIHTYPKLKQVSIQFMPFSSNSETLIDYVYGCIAVKF